MGKVAELVAQHATELQAAGDSYTALYKFSRKHKLDNGRAFPLFKKELLEIGIDYDRLREKAERVRGGLHKEAEFISAATPLEVPVDAVYAWRSFHPSYDSKGVAKPGVLGSFHFPQEYRPGMPMVAVCSKSEGGDDHVAPGENCRCGIYNVADVKTILKNRPISEQFFGSNAPIYAKMAIWGQIYENEKGWRSRFAYPVRLWTNSHRSICELFCPTRPLDDLLEDLGYDLGCISRPYGMPVERVKW